MPSAFKSRYAQSCPVLVSPKTPPVGSAGSLHGAHRSVFAGEGAVVSPGQGPTEPVGNGGGGGGGAKANSPRNAGENHRAIAGRRLPDGAKPPRVGVRVLEGVRVAV